VGGWGDPRCHYPICVEQSRTVARGPMFIRAERENDRDVVFDVNLSAFETPYEANLVDVLREQVRPFVSLVAEENGDVVGHIMFTPVVLSGYPELKVVGLSPLAVAPEHQRKGYGSTLVRTGLDYCRKLGFAAVVVLGHPGYYPRFGFSPSSRFGIDSDFEVPEDVFMALELEPEALSGKTGSVKYHAAFSDQ